jgi:hypothetical protein
MSDDYEPLNLGEPDELPVYNQAMNVIAELKSRVRELEAERDRLKYVFEKEMDHSKFLAELVQHLYGDGWENLTIHEAKKLRTRHAVLVEAAKGALHFVPFVSGYYKALEAALAEVKP